LPSLGYCMRIWPS